MRRWAFLAVLCLVAGPGHAQDKAAVEKLNEDFVRAFNTGDMATLAGMYAEDAYVMPPEADLVQGRDNIQKFWKAASEQIGDLKLTTRDVKPLGGDAAREIGTFILKTKGQQAHEVTGKYVVIWQKVGDRWKLATDIWNTNR